MTRAQISTLWLSFLVLEAFAFVNAYLVNLKGGTVDAVRFQTAAADWAENGVWEFAVNSEFFVQYLGLIYRTFGPHEFIATQFGIVAMLASALVLIQMSRHLGFVMPAIAVLLFLLWPSMVLRVTTTLREPFMIFFTIFSVFALLRFAQTEHLRFAILSLVSLLIGALFHKALAVLVPFLVALFIWRLLVSRRSRKGWLPGLIGLAMLCLGAYVLTNLAQSETSVKGLKPLQSLILWDTDHIDRVLDYKTGRDFRTTYDAAVDFSNPLAFVASLLKAFFFYMFMPFPWMVRTPLDLLALAESLFRLGGLVLMIRFVFLGHKLPKALKPVSVVVLGLCFIWAVGTANYGTASRHHLTTNWVFMLIYIACFKPRFLKHFDPLPA